MERKSYVTAEVVCDSGWLHITVRMTTCKDISVAQHSFSDTKTIVRN